MERHIEQSEVEPTTAVNVAVLIGLMLLLGLTIALSLVDLDKILPGHGWAIPVALAIAAAKGMLVVLYFMHVKYGNRLTHVFATAGALWLAILAAFTIIELVTR